MPTTTDTYEARCSIAHGWGADHGREAASWYFDGNTTRETYERVLSMIEDGDPEVYDTFPSAPLSGEFAGQPTPRAVLHDLGVDEDDDAADDYLRHYEDGFGVAVADTIEAAARAALADDDDDAPTVRELARAMSRRFTRRTRADDTEYTTLSDAAAEWMRDVVREAHGDMLPDDWRFDAIAAAVEFIAEEDDYDDRRDEWADGMVDVYASDLLPWLASHTQRAGYVAEAREEWGDAGEDVFQEIGRGQYLEAREVFDLAERALAKLLEGPTV